MNRPHFSEGTLQLEELFAASVADRAALQILRDELALRNTARSAALLHKVDEALTALGDGHEPLGAVETDAEIAPGPASHDIEEEEDDVEIEEEDEFDIDEQPFLCPECGGQKEGGECLINPGMPDPSKPWTYVLHTISCAECGSDIPGHLAQRWNGMSIDAAKKQWRSRYRREGKGRRR